MADKIRVEVLPIEQGATPDPKNVNKHTQRGGGLLENSLRKRGAFRSIASAGKGAKVPTVYAGNYTLEKAIDAGFDEIVNVHVTGNQLVNVVRDDIAPGSPEAIALGIEDNEIGIKSYNPDIDILAQLSRGEESILAGLRDDDDIFDDLIAEVLDGEYFSSTEKLKEKELTIKPRNLLHILVSVDLSESIESVLGVRESIDALTTLPGVTAIYGANG